MFSLICLGKEQPKKERWSHVKGVQGVELTLGQEKEHTNREGEDTGAAVDS